MPESEDLPPITRVQKVSTVSRFSIIYLAPVLFSLVFVLGTEPWVRVIYVSLIIATYWASEALPLAVTSLIPIAAFPLLGISGTSTVVGKYMSNVVMMFLGGLIVALAVEQANLHKRLALTIIRLVGPGRLRVMVSVMFVTAVLSVFISNTAATAMMIPIVKGVLVSIEKSEGDNAESSKKGMYGTILLLSVAYSANIGGVALVTGTPPNLIAFKILSGTVTFADWFIFTLPLMITNLIACLIYLQAVISIFNWRDGIETGPSVFRRFWWMLLKAFGKKVSREQDHVSQQDNLPLAESPKKKPKINPGEGNGVLNVNQVDDSDIEFIDQEEDAMNDPDGGKVAPHVSPEEHPEVEDVRAFVNRNLKELGPISYRECVVALLFVALVMLWFFQRPKFILGWADHIEVAQGGKEGLTIGAATPAILTVLLLFIIPATNPVPLLANGKLPTFLLDWNVVQNHIPWGIVLLLGGGLALSHGIQVSGLATLIVDQTKSVAGNISSFGLITIVCFFTSMVTEVVSNTATSNIVLPMLVEVSKALCVSPIYFIMSAVITCSNAFMLPVATAPNALVFGAMPPGKLSTGHMVVIGFFLNIISILNTLFWVNTYGNSYFQLDKFPETFSNNHTICTDNLLFSNSSSSSTFDKFTIEH